MADGLRADEEHKGGENEGDGDHGGSGWEVAWLRVTCGSLDGKPGDLSAADLEIEIESDRAAGKLSANGHGELDIILDSGCPHDGEDRPIFAADLRVPDANGLFAHVEPIFVANGGVGSETSRHRIGIVAVSRGEIAPHGLGEIQQGCFHG